MGRIGLADVRHNACAEVKLWRARERGGLRHPAQA
jgi:hypothetical protein